MYCTKDYIAAINSCGNMTVWTSSKIENSRKMVPFLKSGHIYGWDKSSILVLECIRSATFSLLAIFPSGLPSFISLSENRT